MTHDVLQSDIELATRLRDDHRSNEEIILALVQRGVDPGKAAQLADDLRSGRKATVESPLPAELTLARRSRSRGSARRASYNPPRRSPEPESRRAPPAQSPASGRKKPAVIWLVAAALAVLAIGVVGIALFQRAHTGTASQEEQAPKAAGAKVGGLGRKASAVGAAPTQAGSPAPLALELQPDGLYIGGSLVTTAKILPTVANVLGVPTRTNQVGQTGTVIYAYDHHGLLIYSQPGGGTNSIVLDCEATGGANGTTSPFAGTIKIEDQVIGPDTDAQTLTGIKQLGLGSPRTGGSVWGGRYHNLELVFAYLKSPRHLSLIEIDLR
jgi:hypothetical protein